MNSQAVDRASANGMQNTPGHRQHRRHSSYQPSSSSAPPPPPLSLSLHSAYTLPLRCKQLGCSNKRSESGAPGLCLAHSLLQSSSCNAKYSQQYNLLFYQRQLTRGTKPNTSICSNNGNSSQFSISPRAPNGHSHSRYRTYCDANEMCHSVTRCQQFVTLPSPMIQLNKAGFQAFSPVVNVQRTVRSPAMVPVIDTSSNGSSAVRKHQLRSANTSNDSISIELGIADSDSAGNADSHDEESKAMTSIDSLPCRQRSSTLLTQRNLDEIKSYHSLHRSSRTPAGLSLEGDKSKSLALIRERERMIAEKSMRLVRASHCHSELPVLTPQSLASQTFLTSVGSSLSMAHALSRASPSVTAHASTAATITNATTDKSTPAAHRPSSAVEDLRFYRAELLARLLQRPPVHRLSLDRIVTMDQLYSQRPTHQSLIERRIVRTQTDLSHFQSMKLFREKILDNFLTHRPTVQYLESKSIIIRETVRHHRTKTLAGLLDKRVTLSELQAKNFFRAIEAAVSDKPSNSFLSVT